MRVVVTGHLGYIGPVLVSALQDAGHDVAGLDSGLFASCALEPDPPVPTIDRDLRDVSVADLRGFDAVIHLAALSNDPLGFLDPALTREINVDATIRLATLAREAGVQRFLFSSSCSVYGATADTWVDETTPAQPVTPYGVAKAEAEQGLAQLAGPSFCVASLRNATAFGYSPRLRTDLVVNDLVAGAYLHGEISLRSDGSAWRPLVHVQDIARAFTVALSAPAEAINGAVVNVGADRQNYTVRE
ncbi:MAG: NAD-dependent epimerase/dehydratase family protein, partial [Chloroflexota bacterium]